MFSLLFAEIGVTYQDICNMTTDHFFIITNLLKYRNVEREKNQKNNKRNGKFNNISGNSENNFEFADASYIQSLKNRTKKT